MNSDKKILFEVGQEVRVRETSEYSRQREYGVGRVIEVSPRSGWDYTVQYKNDETYFYNHEDLESVEESTREKEVVMSKIASVKHEGLTIILPEKMEIPEAIKHLEKRFQHENQEIEVVESITGFLWDAAIAVQKAMESIFGWVFAEKTESFFGSNPPKMISVATGPKTKVLVPWGSFSLPGVSGTIRTQQGRTEDGKSCLNLVAIVKRRDEGLIRRIAETAREILARESIYRGRAIKLTYDKNDNPLVSFLDLNGIDESRLVYSREVESAIRTSLFTPIEYAPECRKLGVPLKRGILLSGQYGTGKTLGAYVTAKKAVQHGFTFILCQDANDFARVVEFAKMYQPAVVFCEDIDRVTAGERSIDLDTILNTIDGIESKESEVIVVLTTNHVERINPAMLRPGRLDAVINVLPPDAEAVSRLIRLYAGDLLASDVDLSETGQRLAGTIPAVVRECVERAKLAALRYQSEGLPLMITTQALLDASQSMTNQLELLKPKAVEKSAEESLGMSLAQVTEKVLRQTIKEEDLA